MGEIKKASGISFVKKKQIFVKKIAICKNIYLCLRFEKI